MCSPVITVRVRGQCCVVKRWPHRNPTHLFSCEKRLVANRRNDDGVHVHLLPQLLVVRQIQRLILQFLLNQKLVWNITSRVVCVVKRLHSRTLPRDRRGWGWAGAGCGCATSSSPRPSRCRNYPSECSIPWNRAVDGVRPNFIMRSSVWSPPPPPCRLHKHVPFLYADNTGLFGSLQPGNRKSPFSPYVAPYHRLRNGDIIATDGGVTALTRAHLSKVKAEQNSCGVTCVHLCRYATTVLHFSGCLLPTGWERCGQGEEGAVNPCVTLALHHHNSPLSHTRSQTNVYVTPRTFLPPVHSLGCRGLLGPK